MRKSDIHLQVTLDEQNIPEKITWSATDAPFDGEKASNAFLLAVWDGEERNALRIDLWNKEMRIDEMNELFYQTLFTLSDTYRRATNNQKGANDIRQFADAFGKKAGVIQ